MMHGAGEICPALRLSSQVSLEWALRNEHTWNRANKYRTQRDMRDFTDFQKSYILFVFFLSLHLCPTFLLLTALLVPSFVFSGSAFTWKESKKSICTPECNRGCRCVGGELWESNRISFSLSILLALSLLRCFHGVFVLETCVTVCTRYCVCCAPSAFGS